MINIYPSFKETIAIYGFQINNLPVGKDQLRNRSQAWS